MNRNHRRWEQRRRKGKHAFVWQWGVLYWGVGTGLLWGLFMMWLEPRDPPWQWPLIGVIVFPPGGWFWAQAVWRINERWFAANAPGKQAP